LEESEGDPRAQGRTAKKKKKKKKKKEVENCAIAERAFAVTILMIPSTTAPAFTMIFPHHKQPCLAIYMPGRAGRRSYSLA
jgi:hypothetical protein